MKLPQQVIRFAAVGLVNTATDTIIFTCLRQAHVSIFWANLCSTSVGLAVSLTLNYRFTFKSQQLTARRVALYIFVTLFGLWVLQTYVIKLLTLMNTHVNYIHALAHIVGHEHLLISIVPKLASVFVTLVWNYLWYSLVIFKNNRLAAEAAIAQE